MNGESALLALASSVADGDAVDWVAVSAGAQDAHQLAVIERLKIIASIGEVHRSSDNLEPDNTADVRGRVVGHIRPPDPRWRREPGQAPPEATSAVMAQVRWGGLVLNERVGAGVFGEVYRAFDESLRRDVALKLLKKGSRSADLLASKILNEGRLLARVRHRNVVMVHGVDTHDDRVGLWMEFIRGCTLEELLDRQGPFGGREASLIGQDLCRALAAVHGAGLVHRDVKAQNVIREEGGRVVLMDFGTGLLLDDEEAVRASPVAGTPLYLAPEVLNGRDVSPQSDIYALGVLLFHLVTGTYPYQARSLPELRTAQRQGERKRLHDLRPDLAEGFVHVVERALEVDPAARYQSAGALQRGLTHALGLESGSTAPLVLPTPDPVPAAPAVKTLVSEPVSSARAWRVRAPLAIGALVLVGLSVWGLSSLRSAPVPPVNSLLVLPFAGLSSSDADLARGLELLVTDRLASLSAIRTLEYTSAMAARDRGTPVVDVLRRHQVEGAVQGSVTWTSGTARVSVSLVRAGLSQPIWERQFERPAARAAELPRDVAREIVRALAVRTSPGDDARLSMADEASPNAFEGYLRGRASMYHRTALNVEKAITQFLAVLQEDPNHAPSLAALSECYLLQGVTYGTRPLPESAALARQAAQRALSLDDTQATAVQTDAQLKFLVDWDAAGAERSYRRALELAPNAGSTRQHYAMFLAAQRRLPDAMQQMQQAVALDPTSLPAQAALGMIWHYARSNDQAERIFRDVLAVDPALGPARFGLVRTLIDVGRHEEALTHLAEMRRRSNGTLSPAQEAAVGLAYAGLNRRDAARAIAEQLVLREQREGPSVDAASIFVAIGERPRALDLLEQAVAERQPKCLFLRLDPRFDALRTEARFSALLDRLGFAS